MPTSPGPDATWCTGAPVISTGTAHMVATAAIRIQRRAEGETPMRALCGTPSMQWKPVGGVISPTMSCRACRNMVAGRLPRRPGRLAELLGDA